MESLEYKTPESRPSKNWWRRYLIGVPIFAIGYYLGTFAWLAYLIDHMDDQVSRAVVRCFIVYHFPMIFLGGHYGVPSIDYGANTSQLPFVLNALFWGFTLIAIWHATSAIFLQIGGPAIFEKLEAVHEASRRDFDPRIH